MRQFKKINLIKSLKKVGIKKGSTVLVHSGLNYLGQMEGTKNKNLVREIFEILKNFLGPTGTLLFPAFFYDYARKKKIFDLEKSPPCKSLGVLPEYVFRNKKFYRSKHPLNSLIGIGKKSKYICENSNSGDFGIDSAWDRLTKINAEILFLGIPLSRAMTYIHYIEFRTGVPHMYTKKFNIKIKKNKKILENECHAYVRYLGYDINVNQNKFEKDLKASKVLKTTKLGMGFVSAVNSNKVFSFGVKKVSNNPYYFLNNKPKFKKGFLPIK